MGGQPSVGFSTAGFPYIILGPETVWQLPLQPGLS